MTAEQERAAIVAWLRAESGRAHKAAVKAAREGDDDYCAIYVQTSTAQARTADAIERGDHHKEETQ